MFWQYPYEDNPEEDNDMRDPNEEPRRYGADGSVPPAHRSFADNQAASMRARFGKGADNRQFSGDAALAARAHQEGVGTDDADTTTVVYAAWDHIVDPASWVRSAMIVHPGGF